MRWDKNVQNLDIHAEQDLRFRVPSALGLIYEPPVVWASKHEETGAWATIRACGPTMLAEWRSSMAYSVAPLAPVYFHGGAPKDNLAEAIAYCEEQLKAGPPPGVLQQQEQWRASRSRAGEASGAARREKAIAKAAIRDDDPLYVGIDPALRKWMRWEEADFEVAYPVHDEKKWIYKRAPHNGVMLEHLKLPGHCCVIAEPTMNRGDDSADWDLLRDFYPAGDENNQKVTADFVLKRVTYNDCIIGMAKLAKSDPMLWRRGNGLETIKSFI